MRKSVVLSNPLVRTRTFLPSVAVRPAEGLVVSETLPANPLMLLAEMVVEHVAPGVQLTVTGVDGEMLKSCTMTVALPLLPLCVVSPA